MDRILTTHVGSLPRNQAVTDGVFALERGEAIDLQAHAAEIAAAVEAVVARQVQVGVDIVSDGEMSKLSYATYIKDRITGFEGDFDRRRRRDEDACHRRVSFAQRRNKDAGRLALEEERFSP
ncbi:MAG TPA: hypothetical protein DFK16_01975 [Acidimicrobiaceae bacterium]|nr:hypothetical protein [Acidimicrobiaceae bacterium]